MNSSMCTNNDVIELGETDLEWTVGSHTIELVFPSKSVNPESTYIVKCKPTDKSIKRSPKIRTNNKRVIIDNLEGDTKYEISVSRENCDSGVEVSCFTARIFTAKSACSSLLDHAMQDEIIPSIFHLKPVISQDKDDISIEYRRFAYNDSRKSQTSKRVLLLGGENTGKTTLVNVIANHFLGVQYADSFRISITGDCDTVKNGSSNVISCSIDPLETSKYRWNLNIINVRGFKPDAENKNIMKSLKTFLKKKSDPVDLICLVLKSTYRHTTDESKILQAIISAVYDMPNVKFAPLITFHSGGSPLVLKVLRDEAVPCYEDLVFCFNNAKFYQCENEDFDTWDERRKTVIRLLSHLDNQQTYIESSSKSDQPASQRNRIDLHTNSTSDSITIELKCIQKKIKIQYRRKAGEWNGVYAEEPKVVLDNLAADTLYEIRVIEVDDDGNEHRVAEIQEKTKLSKGAKYLKSSSRDSVDPLVNHLSTKTNNVPGAEVRTLDIDGLASEILPEDMFKPQINKVTGNKVTDKAKNINGNQSQCDPYCFNEVQEEEIAQWVESKKLLYVMTDKQHNDKELKRQIWESKAAEYKVTYDTIQKWYQTQLTRFSELLEGDAIKRSGNGVSNCDKEDSILTEEDQTNDSDTDRDSFIRRSFAFLKPHIRGLMKDVPAIFEDKLVLAETNEYSRYFTPKTFSKTRTDAENRPEPSTMEMRVTEPSRDLHFVTQEQQVSRSTQFCKYLETELNCLHDACLESAIEDFTTVLQHFRKISKQLQKREANGEQISPLQDVPSLFQLQQAQEQWPVAMIPVCKSATYSSVCMLQQDSALLSNTFYSTPSQELQAGSRQCLMNQPSVLVSQSQEFGNVEQVTRSST